MSQREVHDAFRPRAIVSSPSLRPLLGLPGRGKTHAATALGDALVRRGHAVLFTPTFRLLPELLAAKRDLALPRALQRLDAFDRMILDDISFVQQSADEVEVLFHPHGRALREAIAARHEQPRRRGMGSDLQEPVDDKVVATLQE